MKWKIGYSILGLLVLVVVGLFLVPRLIDWNSYKADIAALIYEETGKDLTIDGDIELTLLPSITFRATDLRVEEPTFETKSPLMAVKEVSGRIGLVSLLFGELDVQSFILTEPSISLEVSEAGDTNWRLYVSRPEDGTEDKTSASGPLPMKIATLADVRIDNGKLNFLDQRTGQEITVVDLKTDISLPDPASPLLVTGSTTLNKKPVTWTLDLNTLADLEDGDAAKLTGAIKSEFLDITTALNVDLAPPYAVTGDLGVKTSGVGAIAAWLNRPLEEDPGPVEIKATFTSEKDQKTAVSALVKGKDLNATLSGDLDLSTDIPVANLKLEGEVLDFTRYLPAPAGNELAPSVAAKDDDINLVTASKKFRQPVELSFLKEMNATIAIKLEKIITHRITMGPIDANGALQDGKLTAKIENLTLYGGSLTGNMTLTEKDGNASLTADSHMTKIPFEKISDGLALDTLPVSGIGNGSLSFTSEGPTILLLAQNAVFDLDLDLAPIADKSKAAGITAAKVNLARKEKRGPGELKGSVTYNGRQVTLDGNILPKDTTENLTSMDFKVHLKSDLATLKIDGARDFSSTPKTQVTVSLNAPSSQNVANWLGFMDLPKGNDAAADQFDGAAKLLFQKQVLTIETLTFTGPLVDARVTGKYDDSQDTPLLDVTLDGGTINIDRLLSLLPAPVIKPDEKGEKVESDEQFVAFLSDKALDLSILQDFDMNLDLRVKKAVLEDIKFGPIATKTILKEGRLNTTISALQFDGSDLTADLTFDTKPAVYNFSARFNIADWKGDAVPITQNPVIKLEEGTTGQGKLKARGRSARDLVADLDGQINLSIPGLSFTGAKVAEFSDTTINLNIPEDPNTLEFKIKSTVFLGTDKVELPLEADLKTGRLISIAQDSDMPIDITAKVGDTTLALVGKVSNIRTSPTATLDMNFQAPSLAAYQKLIKDLPDIKPVNAKATLTGDENKFNLTGLTAQVGQSDLTGEVSVDLTTTPQNIKASITSNLIDLSVFRTEEPAKTTAGKTEEPAKTTAGKTETATTANDDKYVFKDTPLPLEFLDQFNATLSVDIKKLRTNPVMELANVSGDITVKDKVLTLDPLKMEKDKGTFLTTLTYDASVDQPTMKLSSTIQDLDLVVSNEVRLILDSHSDFTAVGDSPRKLASSLSGRSDWISRKGQIDSGFLGVLSFGAGNIFSTFFGGKKSTAFDCLVFRLDSEDGMVNPVVAMVDTADLIIAGNGDINLKNETLTLTIGTSARTVGVADLVVPILITGTLKSPEAIPDPLEGTKNLSSGLLSLINPVNAVDTVFGTDILGGNKPPCALAFEKIADTKAPADLTLTAEQSKNSGLIGSTAKGAGNILESVGSGIKKLFGGTSD